jgi:hypothetical protein
LSNRPAAHSAYSKEEPTGSGSEKREISPVSDQPAVGSEEPAVEPGELFQSFQDATGSERNKPKGPGTVKECELSLATRRSKFEAAKAASASKEETVAAAFERVHGGLEKRLQPSSENLNP